MEGKERAQEARKRGSGGASDEPKYIGAGIGRTLIRLVRVGKAEVAEMDSQQRDAVGGVFRGKCSWRRVHAFPGSMCLKCLRSGHPVISRLPAAIVCGNHERLQIASKGPKVSPGVTFPVCSVDSCLLAEDGSGVICCPSVRLSCGVVCTKPRLR